MLTKVNNVNNMITHIVTTTTTRRMGDNTCIHVETSVNRRQFVTSSPPLNGKPPMTFMTEYELESLLSSVEEWIVVEGDDFGSGAVITYRVGEGLKGPERGRILGVRSAA